MEKEREWRRGGSTESGACDGTCQQKVFFSFTLAIVEVGCLGKREEWEGEKSVSNNSTPNDQQVHVVGLFML